MSDTGQRVLIVDDESAIRRYLRTALTAQGFVIYEAANGQETLKAVVENHPDVIILDLGLPDFDGVEVTRRLREWSNTPIIILSVREAEQAKIAALDAGADDYLTKPFGTGELMARMRVVMRRLAGKPDYLVRRGRQVIPIEVKSANAPGTGPRRSHLLQLAAYCLLIQENYQQRPKYGIVKYADRVFEVDYTPELETQLMDVIDALRDDLSSAEVHRSHAEPSRCTRCGMRSACSESLI